MKVKATTNIIAAPHPNHVAGREDLAGVLPLGELVDDTGKTETMSARSDEQSSSSIRQAPGRRW